MLHAFPRLDPDNVCQCADHQLGSLCEYFAFTRAIFHLLNRALELSLEIVASVRALHFQPIHPVLGYPHYIVPNLTPNAGGRVGAASVADHGFNGPLDRLLKLTVYIPVTKRRRAVWQGVQDFFGDSLVNEAIETVELGWRRARHVELLNHRMPRSNERRCLQTVALCQQLNRIKQLLHVDPTI